jgi:hypothetical protein
MKRLQRRSKSVEPMNPREALSPHSHPSRRACASSYGKMALPPEAWQYRASMFRIQPLELLIKIKDPVHTKSPKNLPSNTFVSV